MVEALHRRPWQVLPPRRAAARSVRLPCRLTRPPLPLCSAAQEKVTLLERLDFEEVQESECKKHFTRYRLAETY